MDDLPVLKTVADLMRIFGRSESAMRRWLGRRLPEISVGRSVFAHPDDVRRLIQADMKRKVLADHKRKKSDVKGSVSAPSAVEPTD